MENLPVEVKPSLKDRAVNFKNKSITYASQKPWHVGIGASVVVLMSYMLWHSIPEGKPGIPVANAVQSLNAAPINNPKAKDFGQQGELSFTVMSSRKIGERILLNNHLDYRQATQTVVLDLRACPSLGALDPRTLVGRNIFAKGSLGSYNEKPQLTVKEEKNFRLVEAIK